MSDRRTAVVSRPASRRFLAGGVRWRGHPLDERCGGPGGTRLPAVSASRTLLCTRRDVRRSNRQVLGHRVIEWSLSGAVHGVLGGPFTESAAEDGCSTSLLATLLLILGAGALVGMQINGIGVDRCRSGPAAVGAVSAMPLVAAPSPPRGRMSVLRNKNAGGEPFKEPTRRVLRSLIRMLGNIFEIKDTREINDVDLLIDGGYIIT